MGIIVRPGRKGRRNGLGQARAIEQGSFNFNPTAIQRSNLLLWTRGDLGVTLNAGHVSTWADQSGQGNNLTQGTAASQPLWTASVTAINNKPAVDFDGTDDFLLKTGLALAKPTQVFIVAKWDTAFSVATSLFDGANANHIRFYRDAANRVNLHSGVNLASSAVTETNWQYWTLTANGASSVIKQKLTSVASGDSGGNTTDGFTVGAIGGGSSQWADCSVAEIIAYSVVLSSVDEARIQKYLSTRYGL